MNNKDFVLDTMRRMGRQNAQALQASASNMTGTELNAADKYIPDFLAALQVMNMSKRPAGFVCKSSAGRVVKLLQPYNSDVYKGEPEDYPSMWGFVWSQDPAKALPFIALSTSPYNVGDCCTEDGGTYRSKIPNNVSAPSAYPDGWEAVIL